MILIMLWTIALTAVLCLYAIAILVRWFLERPAKWCGVAFDVTRLGQNVRVRPVGRRPRVGCAASESHRLERLLKAREYVAGLEFFADR